MKKWIYIYKVVGDTTLYGDVFYSRFFDEAVKLARSICRAARYNLVGVMPYDVVVNRTPCKFKL